MGTRLIRHEKVFDELENTIEIKLWELPGKTRDKPHGYKYSLVYIVNDIRVIGYDNAEGKGDHKHIKGKTETYKFTSLKKLANDFYRDIQQYKRGKL
jgi:hypothetical protein